MKKLLLYTLLVFFTAAALPQQRPPHERREKPGRSADIGFYTDTHSFANADSSFTVVFTYRVKYNLLVFKKESGTYSAGMEFFLEVKDSTGASVYRDFINRTVDVTQFRETNADDLYATGAKQFTLEQGEYGLQTRFKDINSDREATLRPLMLELRLDSGAPFHPPLIVSSQKVVCDGEKYSAAANFGGAIPFSPAAYDLIIPSADTTIKSIKVEVVQKHDSSLVTLTDSYVLDMEMDFCDSSLIVTGNGDIPYRLFYLEGISKSLHDAPLRVRVSDADGERRKLFPMKVLWIGKPRSLMNPELAVEMLEYITTEEVVDSLLDFDEEELPYRLAQYWKRYDPSPETTYNDLMHEYYQRVDEANEEYSTLHGTPGAKTDRGRVYIQLGSPEKIERTTDSKGKITEIWVYPSINRQFVFVDRKGVGNFQLL